MVVTMLRCAAQGGSVFSKIRLVLAFPSRIPEVLGTALTSSSNFFINFVIIQAPAPAASRACPAMHCTIQCTGQLHAWQ